MLYYEFYDQYILCVLELGDINDSPPTNYIGDIFDQTFTTFYRHFRTCCAIAILPS